MTAPAQAARGGLQPGRLWSLWDMFRLLADRLVEGISTLSGVRAIYLHGVQSGPAVWPDAAEHLAHLRELLVEMDMKASLRFLDQVIQYTNPNSGYPGSAIESAVGMLVQSMEAELQGTLFLGVRSDLAKHFTAFLPFGAAVDNAFPNASEDIDEAGKCLALERPTAAVFHLMRALECAVKALGEALNCTVIDKNDKDLEWGKILGNIGDKVGTMPKGPKKDEWSGVVALLYHVKQAWRNSTMHPKQTYTMPEALAIYEAVRVFMGALATQVWGAP